MSQRGGFSYSDLCGNVSVRKIGNKSDTQYEQDNHTERNILFPYILCMSTLASHKKASLRYVSRILGTYHFSGGLRSVHLYSALSVFFYDIVLILIYVVSRDKASDG